MTVDNPKPNFLEGQLLVATPLIAESCFHRSVVYVCAHNSAGAMGIITNHKIDGLDIKDIMQQLRIEPHNIRNDVPIHFGGPVEPTRGFVLHSGDYEREETVRMGNNIAITSSTEILRDIAGGGGPLHTILALGYAGWEAGQLEKELEENSWLTVPARYELIFNIPNSDKWQKTAESLGIDLTKLSSRVGHA